MNEKASETIRKCKVEIENIRKIKEKEGSTSEIMRYLTSYCAIKCCSSIEIALKSEIESIIDEANIRVKNCIRNQILEKPINPSYKNILFLLKMFDENWEDSLKDKLKNNKDGERYKSNLDSLNKTRHKFAHGLDMTASFDDILNYFNDAVLIVGNISEIILDKDHKPFKEDIDCVVELEKTIKGRT